MATTTTQTTPTHYEILNLPRPLDSLNLSPDQTSHFIKQAYRRALLAHHPDKKGTFPSFTKPKPKPATTSTSTSTGTTTTTYTVDQITQAYTTLSNDKTRADYDRQLRSETTPSQSSSSPNFQTGLETLDLDDLSYRDTVYGKGEWYRACRCGNKRGFIVGEDDLDENEELGELIVGCVDCSLWLRVQFAILEDDEFELGGR
ncbi:hypothetical protein QBC47DRAFT_388638 [Echria macrotheca]|uniref:Diphthamide biosynthesis protein 4 n=1 Tax=Echria macrotheca TaxID=438768 RepID=A0AAJ0F8T7_9PEZI|nr:hypothetical protein QBC47DRAFT_388638 [Echria macrotheca]